MNFYLAEHATRSPDVRETATSSRAMSTVQLMGHCHVCCAALDICPWYHVIQSVMSDEPGLAGAAVGFGAAAWLERRKPPPGT